MFRACIDKRWTRINIDQRFVDDPTAKRTSSHNHAQNSMRGTLNIFDLFRRSALIFFRRSQAAEKHKAYRDRHAQGSEACAEIPSSAVAFQDIASSVIDMRLHGTRHTETDRDGVIDGGVDQGCRNTLVLMRHAVAQDDARRRKRHILFQPRISPDLASRSGKGGKEQQHNVPYPTA